MGTIRTPASSAAAVLEFCRVRHGTAGAIAQPSLREGDCPCTGRTPPRLTDDCVGERLVGIQLGQQVVQSGPARSLRHRAAQRAADRESLEIPGDVLAKIGDTANLADPLGEQLRMLAHDCGDFSKPWSQPLGTTL